MQLTADMYQDIGSYLRDTRQIYGLSIEEVAARIHLRGAYIRAIEEGRIDQLPGAVYARGYIQNYCEFLGVNADEVIARFEGLAKQKPADEFFVPIPTRQESRPTRLLLVGSLVACALLYLGFAWFGSDTPVKSALVEPLPESYRIVTLAELPGSLQAAQCLQEASTPLFPPCFMLADPQWPQSLTIRPPDEAVLAAAQRRQEEEVILEQKRKQQQARLKKLQEAEEAAAPSLPEDESEE